MNDPAATNSVEAMRRVAISRCAARDGIEPGACLEVTDQGNLTCTATLAPGTFLPTMPDDEPHYRTRFELNGKRISQLAAEQVCMGNTLVETDVLA